MLITNLFANHSDSTTSSYATESASYVAGNVYLLAVGVSRAGVGNAPTVTGASLTWTEIATVANGNCRCSLFRALCTSNASGALTIDFSAQNQSNVYWSVNKVTGSLLTGSNGADAIVQSKTGSDTAGGGADTGASVTLDNALRGGNSTFGAIAINANVATTPGTNFAELSDEGTSHKLQTQWAILGDISIDWTYTSNDSAKCFIGVELAAAPSGGNPIFFGGFGLS